MALWEFVRYDEDQSQYSLRLAHSLTGVGDLLYLATAVVAIQAVVELAWRGSRELIQQVA